MATIDMNNVLCDRVSLLIMNLQVDLCLRSGKRQNKRSSICVFDGGVAGEAKV